VRAGLDDERAKLFAETNDLRRRFGQAVWLLQRSITLARGDRTLRAIFTTWASSAASLFRREQERLARLEPQGRDEGLRRLAIGVLETLATDVAGGDARLAPCLRSLEAALDAVVDLLRAEAGKPPVHDLDLARALRHGAATWARGDARAAAEALRATASAVRGAPARRRA
jgi:hypothetical protein